MGNTNFTEQSAKLIESKENANSWDKITQEDKPINFSRESSLLLPLVVEKEIPVPFIPNTHPGTFGPH